MNHAKENRSTNGLRDAVALSHIQTYASLVIYFCHGRPEHVVLRIAFAHHFFVRVCALSQTQHRRFKSNASAALMFTVKTHEANEVVHIAAVQEIAVCHVKRMQTSRGWRSW